MSSKEITGRTAVNNINWHPADGTLPMKYIRHGGKRMGAVALTAGLVWLYLVTAYLYSGDILENMPSLILDILVIAPGIFLILFGLSALVFREETTIDPSSVSFYRRGLLGVTSWREPISGYKGVLKEHWRTTVAGASGDISGRAFRIRLVHADENKEIILYHVESSYPSPPDDWDEKWRYFAGLFNLPVLEKTEDGLFESRVEDIDKSLSEKIADGIVTGKTYDFPSRLGWMADWQREGDVMKITLYPVWTLWKSFAGTILLSVLFGVTFEMGFLNERLFYAFGGLILICVAAVVVSFIRMKARPEQLEVNPSVLMYQRYDTLRRKWIVDELSLRSITRISILKNPQHLHSSGDIVIEGAGRKIRLGWWLPRKTKRNIVSALMGYLAEIPVHRKN